MKKKLIVLITMLILIFAFTAVEVNNDMSEVHAASSTDYNSTKWQKKKKLYPAATKVWIHLKEKGFSDAAAAGIIGNIMAECGGHTLHIKYRVSSRSYYGMCQWSRRYYPQVIGANLRQQCEFLTKTMPKEFKSYGRLSGYSYKSFKKIKNEKTAAWVFAKTYERCASFTYGKRQANATKALKFFTK